MNHPVRPVPITANHRIQSFTPMPQVRKSNTFRPISQSPPPFDKKNITQGLELNESTLLLTDFQQQSTNITLLTRGISLLSITQLRELLRDYSLPTGGNKHILINRVLMFLETFGANQQNILLQFSARLKKYLSYENTSDSVIGRKSQATPTGYSPINSLLNIQTIPQDVKQNIILGTPSCLYEPIPEDPVIYENYLVSGNFIGAHMKINIPVSKENSFPMLQFIPLASIDSLQKIVIQVGGIFMTLHKTTLWTDLTDFEGRDIDLIIHLVDPLVPLCVMVRPMKKIAILQLAQKIARENEPACSMKHNPDLKMDGTCPLTRKLIARPARGRNCMHEECFDLTGFICYSLKNKSWTCPVCNRPLPPDDLCIDYSFFQNCRVGK